MTSRTPDNSPESARTADSARAGRLLDRPLPPGYRAEWARHFAGARVQAGEADAPADTVLIFRLGGEWLALPADLVTEITEPRRSHSLPHRRDRLVRGIVNVRGELLVKIALAELLGIEGQEPAASQGTAFARLVVIGRADRRVAFHADEVHGLHRHGPEALRALPVTVDKNAARFASAVLDWDGRAVGRLDGAGLLDAVDRSLA
ncbi:chemotaxis protein CheW [Ancylobacter radicis]|uniref:Chemotaxis protein CheW n=1 Tax=Ancylobacter radicis TaxID=2836179 RepID=A0ABS5R7X1_9HYPH|nr:chemotaxis protein CheW [Ancylobacter radicis]MBS9477607.1 chemotaxis protein CheW [Ancylobacter radicis]